MRKGRRLTNEQLVPWVWELPRTPSGNEESPIAAPFRPAASVAPSIDWQNLFGNANPVEIEVGTGKGLFLLNAATSRPDTNFFGIEIVRKYQLYAATRYAIRNLPNVKTTCATRK